jgi:hypothetical protein
VTLWLVGACPTCLEKYKAISLIHEPGTGRYLGMRLEERDCRCTPAFDARPPRMWVVWDGLVAGAASPAIALRA